MADETQLVTDSGGSEANDHLQRRQEFADLVADAVRRAEAMQRLELSLIYGSVVPTEKQRREHLERRRPRHTE